MEAFAPTPDVADDAVSPDEGMARRYLRIGYVLLGLLVLGIGGWAVFTNINGAVVAPGVVVVENRPRDIQHLDGGIVAEILAREGQVVERGDILLRLDPTIVDANTQVVRTRLSEAQARLARLAAERDGADVIVFPDTVLGSDDPMVKRAKEGQAKLFDARQTAANGLREQLNQRIRQSGDQISGLESRNLAAARQVQLIDDELTGLRQLLARGFVSKTRILALERERSRLQGEMATARSEIARIQNNIGETRVQILQLEKDRQTEVLSELREVQTEAAELEERLTAALDQGRRISVRAPVGGRVLNSEVNTIGEVIAPGALLMQIVPADEKLLIETQVNPADIDQVYPGQTTRVRLSAFNQRRTPELFGEVTATAPDRLIDEVTGMPYFAVRVQLNDGEMDRLPPQLELQPGMPAEAYIQTERRTVLSYLLKPAEDAMSRAWREE